LPEGLRAQGSGSRAQGKRPVEGFPSREGPGVGWISDPLPGGVRGWLDFRSPPRRGKGWVVLIS